MLHSLKNQIALLVVRAGDRNPDTKPGGQFVFRGGSGHGVLHYLNCLGRLVAEDQTVQSQKQPRYHPGNTFVSIDKSMILGEAERIGSGEYCGVRILVCGAVDQACERGQNRALVAYPSATAMFRDLAVVHCEDHSFLQPDPGHFANWRRISRSACM